MPAAIPLIIMAAASAAQLTATALLIAQIAAAASAVAVGSWEARKARKKAASAISSRDMQVTVRSGVEAHRTVIGRALISGTLAYAVNDVAGNKFLHRVSVLTGHQLDAFEKVYFNDDELVLGAALPATGWFSQAVTGGRYMENGLPVAHVEGFVGEPDQAASAWLVSASGGQWTNDHRLRGRAYLHVLNNYTPNVYTEGLPEILTLVRGARLYDPRTGTTAWSTNPALAIRHHLKVALAVPDARIDDASFQAAANLCDEWVQLNTATTGNKAAWDLYMAKAVEAGLWEHVAGDVYRQRRYTCNGSYKADDAPGEVLDQLVQSCAGWLSRTGGVWRLVAGGYTEPTLTLDEDDLRAPVQFTPRPGRRDLFNVVRGAFVGPLNRYVATEFDPLAVPAFVAADGGLEMPLDLDLPFTNDAVAAQRVGSIYLQRSRQGVLLFPASLTALALRPGDTVRINLAAFGFTGEVFRVESWTLTEDLGVDLVLREEAAAQYTWVPGATIRDPSPQLNLPSPWQVPAVTNLQATSGVATTLVQTDGTIVQRTRITWDTTDNAFARHLEIETRESGATTWTPHPTADDSAGQAYLVNMRTGVTHDIRVRRLNTVGARSDWTMIAYVPLPVQAVANLLRNSDFTEDLGYPGGITFYTDSRALRHWSNVESGGNFQFGRNYYSGRVWNIGLGGCCIYDPSNTVNAYAYLRQAVPVLDGVEYEASVSVAPHRCNVNLYLRYFNASGTMLAEHTDAYDSGASVVGSETNPSTWPRLWVKGVAPATTATAEVYLLCQGTASSTPYPFSAWHKAMLCVAPSGVTKETATPWVPSATDTVDGQLQATFTRLVADTGNVAIVTGPNVLDSFSVTPAVSGVLDVAVSCDAEGNDGGAGMGGYRHIGLQVKQGSVLAGPEYQPIDDYTSNSGGVYQGRKGYAAIMQANVVAGATATVELLALTNGTLDFVRARALRYTLALNRKV